MSWSTEDLLRRAEGQRMKLVCSVRTVVHIALWAATLGFLLGLAFTAVPH